MARATQYHTVCSRRSMVAWSGWCLLALASRGPARAQEPGDLPKAASPTSDVLDPEGMAAELERLDGVCERLGLSEQRQLMRRWTIAEPTDAHPLFLPVAADPLARSTQRGTASGDNRAMHANWLKHFTSAREKHARYWIAEARRAVEAGDEWAAYRHLWRAIREDPNNADAKAALGPLLPAMNVRSRPRPSAVPYAQLSWAAGSFTRLETANFEVLSRADAQQTIAIATQLEQFHALWTQMFFPLWAPPGVTKARLAGRSTRWEKRRQFNVVVCKDRRDYLAALGASEENIGVSVGYYNAQMQVAIFYPDQQLPVTLAHEMTHQLLAEGSQLDGGRTAGNESGFWMVEGAALYMESLADHGDHWRVGGWLAPRLQAARYRALHDGYWNEGSEFASGGMDAWKADAEISKLYTQAAALSHYFLDNRLPAAASSGEASEQADSEKRRAGFYQALVSVYQGAKQVDDPVSKWLRSEDAQRDYVQFLQVRDEHLQADFHPEHVTELVLTRSELSSESWQRVGRLENLVWLDVSFSNAKSIDLVWLGNLKSLERLSLEGTAIDESTMELISHLPRLKELDLSQCALDDAALRPLKALRTLETLWLSGTQVTAESAPLIESLPKLTFVALNETQIPAAEAQQLSQRIEQRASK